MKYLHYMDVEQPRINI